MKTNVIVNTSFEATHCWSSCPIEEVSFLRYPHRHIFHVQVKAPVQHNDRDIEFIVLKRQLNGFIREAWEGRHLDTMSCEAMAELLLTEFPELTYIRVMEDGENGAEIQI